MSLTKVTYSMIQGAVFNVLDYGATGDGSTNDQAACQAAIDAAVAAGGGVVYFPAGTYSLTSVASSDTTPNGLLIPHTSTWDANTAVTLQGDGVDSVLLAGNATMCVLRNSRVFTTIRNLRIDGGPKTDVIGLGVMPESITQTTTITSNSNMTVENVWIENCRRGMHFQPGPTVMGSDSGCFYHSITNLFSNLNDEHVYMISDVTASGNRVTRTTFVHCTFLRGNTGINLFKGTEIDFVSCNWELIADGTTPTATPVSFYYADANPANIRIVGGYAEACTSGVIAASQAIAVQMSLINYSQAMANDATVAFMSTVQGQNWVVPKVLNQSASISLGDSSFVSLVADPANGGVKVADMQVNSDSMQTWLAGTRIAMLYPTVMPVYTVATLPTAASAGIGGRATVSDATATTFASIPTGGGANLVPVYSTGSGWLIG